MSLARELALRFPHLKLSVSPRELSQYSRDLWPRRLIELRERELHPTTPLVVWPERAEDVSELLRFAEAKGVRVVPFGAGSGVCGAISPDASTLVMDLKRMASFSVHQSGHFVDVEPGVMGLPLEEDLERRGFTIGHFPSSIVCSTVGGWVAARGAGQCSGRYGKIEDMVSALDVVTGKGELVTARYRQSAPNLLPLLIGSEGTLGILTRASLRLHAKPEARAFLAFDFAEMEQGMHALRRVFQHGLRPSVTRLYDPLDSWLFDQSAKKSGSRSPGPVWQRVKHSVLRRALRLSKLGFAAVQGVESLNVVRSLLILVLEGKAAEVADDVERARAYCRAEGGEDRGEEPARRWFAHRYDVSFKQSGVFAAGAFSDTFEIATTWSKLKAAYDGIRKAISEEALVLAHLSHAYPDGCSIYFTLVGSGENGAESLAKYDRIWRAALSAAIEAGATISHHHGIGRSKLAFLHAEWGPGGALLQKAVRQAWDPEGLLNPGNLEPVVVSTPADARRSAVAPLGEAERVTLDELSLSATAHGDATLSEVQRVARTQGLHFKFSESCGELSVAQWIAQGAPGSSDAWRDPVIQTVSGLTARLAHGYQVVIKSVPRRATGPDLRGLFLGAHSQIGDIEQATLLLSKSDTPRVRDFETEIDREPELSEGERQIWSRIAEACTRLPE